MVLLFNVFNPFLFFDLCSVGFFVVVNLEWRVTVLVIMKCIAFSVFARAAGAARVNVVYVFAVLNFVFRDLVVSSFRSYDETERLRCADCNILSCSFVGAHVPDA